MKKILFIVVILLIAAFGIGAGSGIGNQLKGQTNTTKDVLPAQESTPNDDTQQVQEAIEAPQTLTIPKINLTADLESVGMDEKGSMDTPEDADNGAWYNLGVKPGQNGNAVIAGHYDKADGSPAVFWDLTKLTAGDEIITTDTNGNKKTFEVTRIEKFPYDNFPLQEVFGDASESMLNLITCEGDWDSSTGMYSHRTVVFSKLVE